MVYHLERLHQRERDVIQIYSGGHMATSQYYNPEMFMELVCPGDVIFLGKHFLVRETADTNILAPLQWTVIEKRGTRLLLLNRYQIELTLVGDGNAPFRYRDSFIRQYLCRSLSEWFQDWELALLADTYLGETKNPVFGTADDPGVTDKVFLLTAEEVLKYFDPAAYAHRSTFADRVISDAVQCFYPMCDSRADAPVVLVESAWEPAQKARDACLELEICDLLGWWTRTPGSETGRVVLYASGGRLLVDGCDADADEVGVRPACWLDMEKLKNGA